MKKKDFFYYFLLLILTIPAVSSLLKSGFFPSHDGEWMIVRLSDFHRSLVSGQFPVRWAARLNHQFGYPVFNFLYPLSLYIGEFFHLTGLNFIWSIKAVFVLSFLLSGLFMFLWIKEKWGNSVGLVAALLYVYTPYRMVDVYVRGSLGEALSFVWPPLIFWMIERISQKSHWRDIAIGSLALGALITSHNTQAMLFIGLLVFYIFYLYGRKRNLFCLLPIAYCLTLGLGLSAFFWLPALLDKQFVIFDQAPVSNFFHHFPSLSQLIIPSWGYGPSLPLSNEDKMSFQVGGLNLLAGLGALILWLKNRNKKKVKIGFFITSFCICIFLMLSLSSWVWRLLFIYDLTQFPWRLLSLTTFISSVLMGFLTSQLKRNWQIFLSLIAALFLIFQSRTYAQPEYITNQQLSFYATNEASTTVSDEYTPIWVKELPQKRADKKVEILQGKGEIREKSLNSKQISFLANIQETSRIRVNIHYFPGWSLAINGQKEKIDYQENGLIEFSLPSGEYHIIVSFGETPLRLFADGISFLSLLIVGGLIIKKRKLESKKNAKTSKA